jgi:hypothetical protein
MKDSRASRWPLFCTLDQNHVEVEIVRLSILVLSSILVGACASEPVAQVEAGSGDKSVVTQSKVCNQAPQTGSHLSRCGPSTVESISRDDLEMIKSRTNSMPMEPGTTRGR